MKKILFVINTMGRAGAETALMELMRRLLQTRDYELSLFAMIPQGEMFDAVPEGVRILNKRYSNGSVLSAKGRLAICLHMLRAFFHRLTGFRMLGYLIKNYRQQKKSGRVQYDKLLWRVLSGGTKPPGEHFDLAVAYLEGASTYYVADRVSADKKAAFVHIDYQRAGYLPMMDRGCYDHMDSIFAVSREALEKFRAVYPQYKDNSFLFRNLLNRGGILKKAEEGEGFTDGFTGYRLVSVGRLHYQKAYDLAVQSLAMLRKDGYNVRWYVLGEGPERSAIEKSIEALGIKEDFVLMGAQSNPYPFIKGADIFVQATRFEGKSIAVEEAQILGKVIVASDCTGNAEQIVSGYDGVLYPLSVENTAHELEKVLDDPALRATLSEHAKEKELDYPEDMDRLLELLN